MQSRKIKLATIVATIGIAGAAWAFESPSRTSVVNTGNDAAITAGIKAKLMADTDTKARQIDVETSNGVVQLNGFVDSGAARNEAERLASMADGVTEVRNNLEIRPRDRTATAVVDDAAVTAKVDAALAADTRTSALRIDVETREGEVQLSGFAKSAAEKAAAERITESVNGVRTVSNEINVR